MKPITAFITETVQKLNISTSAEPEDHTAWTEKGLYISMKGKEKVSSKNFPIGKTNSIYTGYKTRQRGPKGP